MKVNFHVDTPVGIELPTSVDLEVTETQPGSRGDTVTNELGEFFLEFTEKAFRDVFERRPDVYVRVFDPTGTELLATTERAVRWDASPVEHFEIDVPEE